jgi:magnesium-transporting ATPase (P-type)
MSVVVKDQESGVTFLLTKGADLAIFERLSTALDQPFLEATKEDLIKFSTKGFRTLCFAVRVLDENYFADWKVRYENSKLEMIKLGLNKLKSEAVIDNLTEKLQNELEKDLFLLGATALEDKL